MRTDWLFLAARLVLGGVFVYASLDKLMYPERMAEIIYYYRLLPDELVNIAALVLPMVELMAGMMLILGVWTFPAALVLTGMILLFMGAVGFNLARGLDFQCGCFSADPDAQSAGAVTLLLEAVLLAPAAVCLTKAWRELRSARKIV